MFGGNPIEVLISKNLAYALPELHHSLIVFPKVQEYFIKVTLALSTLFLVIVLLVKLLRKLCTCQDHEGLWFFFDVIYQHRNFIFP